MNCGITAIILVFLLITGGCSAQPRSFPAGLLKKDLRELVNQLRHYHPGLYRHLSKDSLEMVFAEAEKTITDPMTDWSYFRVISRMIAAIGCGHTQVLPSQNMRQELGTKGYFFPCKVRFAGKEMCVQLPDRTWASVKHFNDQPVSKILELIKTRLSSDGLSEIPRYDMLRSFWRFYAWYVEHSSPVFELDIQKPGKKTTERIAIPAVSEKDLPAALWNTPQQPLLHFEITGNIAYMRIGSFSTGRLHANYNRFLATSFAKLKKEGTGKLIIDIRGNAGGEDEYGALLYSYLSGSPFSYFKKVVRKTGEEITPVPHPGLKIQAPSENHFPGQVCLLIDGLTFSTAADLAAVFKHNRRGLIIGRESSGGYAGNNSGETIPFTLPNTGIVVYIPRWYYENAVSEEYPHRGVIPDIPVIYTMLDLSTDIDKERETSEKMMRK